MTIGELIRWLNSQSRQRKNKAKEKAAFNYIQADLIGKSIARIYSKSSKLPSLYEVYPTLFTEEEQEEREIEMRDKLSIMRFEQFALAHNQKFNGGEKDK